MCSVHIPAYGVQFLVSNMQTNILKYFKLAAFQRMTHLTLTCLALKEGLYRILCGENRLGDSGVHTLGDTSAFVNPEGQLLLTRRGKTTMDGVGIVFEFYIAHL